MGRFESKIVGIDLGTTNTLLAYYDGLLKKGICCPNGDGSRLTASAVCFFSQKDVVVGSMARDCALVYPDITATRFKRLMGVEEEAITVEGETYSPQQLSALVLKSVMNDAEAELGEAITEAVITVPAYFGSNRRRATIEAGRIAGLKVKDLLDEPVAAIYNADSIKNLEGKLCLVCDLGGQTLDIVVAYVKKASIDELLIAGDLHCGGSEWDQKFIEYLKKTYLKDRILDEEDEQELALKAEMAKKLLSEKTQTRFSVGTDTGRVEITVTRQEFEDCTFVLSERVKEVLSQVQESMQERGLPHPDQIILAGGATRMPQIQQVLRSFFPGAEIIAKDVDQAVAQGAAIYARMLQDEEQPSIRRCFENPEIKKLNRVTGRSYGIAAFAGKERKVSNMILRNAALPQETEKIYYTKYENQRSVSIHVYENIQDRSHIGLSEAAHIGMCQLQIKGDLPIGSPITIILSLDEKGTLHVKGREESGLTEAETYMDTQALWGQGDFAEHAVIS